MLEVNKNNSRLTEFNFGKKDIQKDDCNTKELYSEFKEPYFSGWYKEIVYDDLKIGHGKLTVSRPMQVHCNYTDATIEMIFVLKGTVKAHLPDTEEKQRFKGDTHNLFHCANNHALIEFKEKKMHFINIQLAPSFFEGFMPRGKAFDTFKNLIQNRQTGYLQHSNFPITPAIALILEEIIESPWKGHYRKIFLHAKVLELLLLQLDQCRYDSTAPSSTLSELDAVKIQRAKEHIINNYDAQITIPKLAKLIGTNEFTLKKGFRELVGTTVFGYINDIKMHRAKKLLAQKNLSISQVSEMVGYKNPQHFTTAFKKKFGIVPSKFK
ncbi:helix-turn-helix transcriptional regulator [Galbibacter pacificus]|uniref:AraC family transcriptional regulator n=1 Tax=Galbibacter pacificus TaxID=2996052 RepID=A0ABT6FN60_9FLAO|nr:AraC family transcriptional regulator [Galbibacter pacificus]MDG3581221.1 AraC family transcriptional regulator [Galbibacter pacificus]MDG3584699.1 AraC family transcriptional regulator [Galbibacter pacificus]